MPPPFAGTAPGAFFPAGHPYAASPLAVRAPSPDQSGAYSPRGPVHPGQASPGIPMGGPLPVARLSPREVEAAVLAYSAASRAGALPAAAESEHPALSGDRLDQQRRLHYQPQQPHHGGFYHQAGVSGLSVHDHSSFLGALSQPSPPYMAGTPGHAGSARQGGWADGWQSHMHSPESASGHSRAASPREALHGWGADAAHARATGGGSVFR